MHSGPLTIRRYRKLRGHLCAPLRVTAPEYVEVMSSRIDLFAIERHADLPRELRRWLALSDDDVLSSPWLIVSSAAMRQRLDWDVAECGIGDIRRCATLRITDRRMVGDVVKY